MKIISIDGALLFFLGHRCLAGLLLLPVVVRLVQFLLSHRLGLQGFRTQLFKLDQFLGDFVVLLDEAVVVIIERARQAFL